MISALLVAPTKIPSWVWGVLLVLHVSFLSWQLRHRLVNFPDSDRYVEAARNLRTAGVLYARPLTGRPLSAQEYSIRPPGYPVFLAALGGTDGTLPVLVLLVQNLLSLLNIGLALRWVARHRPAMRPGQWAALLALAVVPGQFIYANVLMSEMLLQSCVIGLWLSLTSYFITWQPKYLAVAAVLTAAALLIKPVFYPFIAVLLLLSGWAAWRQRRPVVLLIGCLPLVVALGWQTRNLERTGYFHFSSIAEINLLRYNVRAVLQATEGPAAAEQFVASTVATAEQQPDFAGQQRYIQRQSKAVLLRHPVAYARLQLQGMLNFFLDPGRFDVVYFFDLPQQSTAGLLSQFSQHGYTAIGDHLRRLPLGLLVGLLAVAATNVLRLGLLLRFATRRALPWAWRLPLLGLVVYVALLTGPLGAARFVVPVLPLLLAAAGVALGRTHANSSSAVG